MKIEEFGLVVDGERVDPRVISMAGRPDRVHTTDVLMIHGTPPLLVGDRTRLDLRNTGPETGLVFETGQEWPVACRIGDVWTDDEDDGGESRQVFVNPLAEMSAAEAKSIRGVDVNGWRPGIESELAKIDWKHCVLSIDASVLQSNDDPTLALPNEVRYLTVGFSSWGSDDRFDASWFSNLCELQVLVVSAFVPVEIDVDSLTGSSDLRVLHIANTQVGSVSQFGAFPQLRDLDLSGSTLEDPAELDVIRELRSLRRLKLARCEGLESISFVRHLDSLEFLDISRTEVSDLTCLQDLARLERIVAVKTPLASLPAAGMPSLGYMNILSSVVDEAQIEGFRRRHPAAKIRHGWAQTFRDEVSGTDRVRVRSGGTCHRDVEREETLVDESDPAAIEQLVSLIEIDEPVSEGHCMCCGDPTIEFYRGTEKLLAEIGLHHGRSARWQWWPEDATLTDSCRDRLATWLAERGATSFQDEHSEARARETGEEALVDDCLELLPPACSDLWGSSSSDVSPLSLLKSLGGDSPSVIGASGPSVMGARSRADDETMVLAIEQEVEDPVEVATLAFRLLGCGEGSWNQVASGGLHKTALGLLEKAEPSVRGDALKRAVEDPAGREGATRWLLYHGGPDTVAPDVLDEHIRGIVMHGLTHPRTFNRRHTLALLGTGEGPFVLEMLRTVLQGIPVRLVDARHATEADGWVVNRGGEAFFPEDASDAAAAAKLLARLGDADSYRTICELAGTADEPSRGVFNEAKDLLERTPATSLTTRLARRVKGLFAKHRRRGEGDDTKPN